MNMLQIQKRRSLSATLAVFALLALITAAGTAQKPIDRTSPADPAMDRPTAAEVQNALPGREEQSKKEAAAAELHHAVILPADKPSAPPANDMFANAEAIYSHYSSVTGTNVDATIEPGEPGVSSNNKTVWYRWEAVTNLSMTFQTKKTGTLADSVIGIYTGSSVNINTLTLVGWNDDINGANDRHSRVTMIARAGTTYFIQVRGYGDAQGTFELEWEINRAEQGKQFNFDGHNGSTTSDLSVYRPSIGTWYIWFKEGQTFKASQWGVSTDKVVPGDYDGDGGTDIAVWRPSTGVFHILSSMDGTYSAFQWGISSDKPVLGDFDGDDHADLAVWRPSTGTFYIRRSSDGGSTVQHWGQNGDVLACGDYDGDGKTDFGIRRPTYAAVFYILLSSNNSFYAMQFGLWDDYVVPGDYDNDGKNDIAVYRSTFDEFYISRSSDGGFKAIKWGTADDYPIPGDYVGLYASDLCVWRQPTGTFYCWADGGNGGFYSFKWGQSGDYPIAFSNIHIY